MELTKIKTYIEGFEKTEQEQVLQLIIKHNIDYTENSNGVFVNLSNIDKDKLNILILFIKYIIHVNNNVLV